jgi:hypothetical protein
LPGSRVRNENRAHRLGATGTHQTGKAQNFAAMQGKAYLFNPWGHLA